MASSSIYSNAAAEFAVYKLQKEQEEIEKQLQSGELSMSDLDNPRYADYRYHYPPYSYGGGSGSGGSGRNFGHHPHHHHHRGEAAAHGGKPRKKGKRSSTIYGGATFKKVELKQVDKLKNYVKKKRKKRKEKRKEKKRQKEEKKRLKEQGNESSIQESNMPPSSISSNIIRANSSLSLDSLESTTKHANADGEEATAGGDKAAKKSSKKKKSKKAKKKKAETEDEKNQLTTSTESTTKHPELDQFLSDEEDDDDENEKGDVVGPLSGDKIEEGNEEDSDSDDDSDGSDESDDDDSSSSSDSGTAGEGGLELTDDDDMQQSIDISALAADKKPGSNTDSATNSPKPSDSFNQSGFMSPRYRQSPNGGASFSNGFMSPGAYHRQYRGMPPPPPFHGHFDESFSNHHDMYPPPPMYPPHHFYPGMHHHHAPPLGYDYRRNLLHRFRQSIKDSGEKFDPAMLGDIASLASDSEHGSKKSHNHSKDEKDPNKENEDTENSSETEDERFVLGMPVPGRKGPIGKFRNLLGAIINYRPISMFLIFLVMANAVILGAMTYDLGPEAMEFLNFLDTIFLCCFTVEFTFQFTYLGLALFQNGWLVFDGTIVMLSWVFVGGLLRSFRVFRIYTIISRWHSLRNLVYAVGKTLPKMTTIWFALLIFFYSFCVLYTTLYGGLYDRGFLDYDYFGSLENTFLTLFQFMTLDSWSGVVRQVLEDRPWALLGFLVWIILTAFFVLNLVIAVICEALLELNNLQGAQQAREYFQQNQNLMAFQTEELYGETQAVVKLQAEMLENQKEIQTSVKELIDSTKEQKKEIQKQTILIQQLQMTLDAHIQAQNYATLPRASSRPGMGPPPPPPPPPVSAYRSSSRSMASTRSASSRSLLSRGMSSKSVSDPEARGTSSYLESDLPPTDPKDLESGPSETSLRRVQSSPLQRYASTSNIDRRRAGGNFGMSSLPSNLLEDDDDSDDSSGSDNDRDKDSYDNSKNPGSMRSPKKSPRNSGLMKARSMITRSSTEGFGLKDGSLTKPKAPPLTSNDEDQKDSSEKSATATASSIPATTTTTTTATGGATSVATKSMASPAPVIAATVDDPKKTSSQTKGNESLLATAAPPPTPPASRAISAPIAKNRNYTVDGSSSGPNDKDGIDANSATVATNVPPNSKVPTSSSVAPGAAGQTQRRVASASDKSMLTSATTRTSTISSIQTPSSARQSQPRTTTIPATAGKAPVATPPVMTPARSPGTAKKPTIDASATPTTTPSSTMKATRPSSSRPVTTAVQGVRPSVTTVNPTTTRTAAAAERPTSAASQSPVQGSTPMSKLGMVPTTRTPVPSSSTDAKGSAATLKTPTSDVSGMNTTAPRNVSAPTAIKTPSIATTTTTTSSTSKISGTIPEKKITPSAPTVPSDSLMAARNRKAAAAEAVERVYSSSSVSADIQKLQSRLQQLKDLEESDI